MLYRTASQYFLLPLLGLTAFIFAGSVHPMATATDDRPAPGEPLDLRLRQELVRVRDHWNEEHSKVDPRGFPGITFAYVLPDGRTSAVAVGFADLDRKVPLQADDRMLAGSIGKTFVAAVLLQLIEEGRVGFDQPIRRFFRNDDWFSRLANSAQLTPRMLLAHRTGIAQYDFTERILKANDPDRVWTPIDRLPLDKPAAHSPGTVFEYEDQNYDLAALLIERITHNSYYSEVNRRFLQPLHLTATYPQNNSGIRHLPGLVNAYQLRNGLLGVRGDFVDNGTVALSPSFEWGGGGLVSNAQDLASWVKILYGHRILTDRTLDEMFRTPSPMNESGVDVRYGLGVQIRTTRWGTAYGHGGYMPGFISQAYYFPKYDLAVAMQTNSDYIAKMMSEEPFADVIETMVAIIVREQLRW
jgi:D-alanyl-D-alanine carboxypeptidase